MENSVGVGFMAVFAVSGSVVFIARQVHQRLFSDFMKKIEYELGGSAKCDQAKKRVRFADDVMIWEPPSSSSHDKEYRRRNLTKPPATVKGGDDDHQALMKMKDTMPLNRQILYKGILEYKNLKAHDIANFL